MKTSQRKFKKYPIILLAIIILAGVVYIAPNYLAYADAPKKSDAVMILDGPDYIARRKEAVSLVKKGYAEYIFAPGHAIFLTKTFDVTYTYSGNDTTEINAILKEIKAYRKNEPDKHKSIFEKTHQELITAKLIMERTNSNSAIFVSNPYHMRRIKLIAAEVFENSDFKMYFVPSGYSKISKFWLLHTHDVKWIFSEYVKGAWFLLYSHFSSPS